MTYRSKAKLLIITVAAMLFPIFNSHAITLQINTAQSVVHTTNWGNWDWSNWGAPNDGIDIAISGVFDLAIKPGVTNVFTNFLSPNRIEFTNISVPTNGSNGRSWQFPFFEGFFDFNSTSGFSGSEDPCFSFGYYLNGSCFSAGTFASYEGTWDGSNLVLSGRKNPDFNTGANAFTYRIVATAIPEPATSMLVLLGTLLLLMHREKRQSKTASLRTPTKHRNA